MQKRYTSHVFWFILTLIAFGIGGPFLGIIAIIAWLWKHGANTKHNDRLMWQHRSGML